jgi:hypothetical protein
MKRLVLIAATAIAMFTAGVAVAPATAEAATTCSEWQQEYNGAWIYWCTETTTSGWTIHTYYYWNGYRPVKYKFCYWRTGWGSSAPTCMSL